MSSSGHVHHHPHPYAAPQTNAVPRNKAFFGLELPRRSKKSWYLSFTSLLLSLRDIHTSRLPAVAGKDLGVPQVAMVQTHLFSPEADVNFMIRGKRLVSTVHPSRKHNSMQYETRCRQRFVSARAGATCRVGQKACARKGLGSITMCTSSHD